MAEDWVCQVSCSGELGQFLQTAVVRTRARRKRHPPLRSRSRGGAFSPETPGLMCFELLVWKVIFHKGGRSSCEVVPNYVGKEGELEKYQVKHVNRPVSYCDFEDCKPMLFVKIVNSLSLKSIFVLFLLKVLFSRNCVILARLFFTVYREWKVKHFFHSHPSLVP